MAHWLPTLACVLLSLLLHAADCTTGPGVRMRLTTKGIDYINSIAQDALRREVQTLSLGNQYGRSGRAEYWFNNVRVAAVPTVTSRMTLDGAHNGITWQVSDIGVSLSGDWRVKYKKGWFKISTSGSAGVSVSGTSISVSLGLGKDLSGRPALSVARCSANVARVSASFRGGIASWLLNMFSSKVEGKLRDIIQGKMCDIIRKQVNSNAKSSLGKLKVTVDIANKFLLDYSLVSAPRVSAGSLETDHKGVVYWAANRTEPAAMSPGLLPESGRVDKMLYIWLSDFTANTFAYAAHNNGYFTRNLTSQDMPSGYRDVLNTSCVSGVCIGQMIPELRDYCPDCVVNLALTSSEAPTLTTSPSKSALSFKASVAMLGITADNTRVPLLTLGVHVNLTLAASVGDDLITGRVLDSSINFHVINSNIAQDINMAEFNQFLNLGMKILVIPNINTLAAQGFALPVSGDVVLVNPRLQLVDGALVVETDVRHRSL